MSAEKDRPEISVPDRARREVKKLVLRFQRNREVYTRPDYKETRVRVEFIDPFFEAATGPADKGTDALVYELFALTDQETTTVETPG